MLENFNPINKKWSQVFIEPSFDLVETSRVNINFDVDDAIRRLRKFGIVILSKPIPMELLLLLNREFDWIMEGRSKIAQQDVYTAETGNDCVKLKVVDYWGFPGLYGLFSNQIIIEIAKQYFEESFHFDHKVYLSSNLGVAKSIMEVPFVMHWDVTHSLQFYIYLDQTDSDNGAFTCIPGGHIERRKERERELSRADVAYADIKNTFVCNSDEVVSVDGLAGTLFFIDSDIPHAAGWVKGGNKRRLLRNTLHTWKEVKRRKSMINK